MRNSNNIVLSGIIRIPYQCHCIQLSFSVFSKNRLVSSMFEVIKEITKVLRIKIMEKIFRSLIPTRWTNIKDILSWGINNWMRLCSVLITLNPKIRKIIEQERDKLCTFLFSIIPNLYLISNHVLKQVQIFETNDCKAFICIFCYEMLMQYSMKLLKYNNDQLWQKIHEVFIETIRFGLFSTSKYELLVCLYSLTLNGRAFVRKTLDFGSILEPDNIDEQKED